MIVIIAAIRFWAPESEERNSPGMRTVSLPDTSAMLEEVRAVTGSNGVPAVVPSEALFSELAKRIAGSLLLPGCDAFDQARRLFNSMIDRVPAAIAQVRSAQDVAEVVLFARANNVPVTVRSGGHNIAGHAVQNGAIMIDLSLMTGVEVDVEARIGHVGGGARLGGMIEAMEQYGLVTPTGTDFDTGVGGLTLGGGYGWLYGKYGMSVDNVVGAEMVLADGSIVETNANQHPDLFWAIRGGSGNFGVVTTFHLALHPLAETLSGMLLYPYPMAREVLRYNRTIRETAPDELTTYLALVTGPDGAKAAAMIFCWSGDMAEGERFFAPIRAWRPAILDTIQPMPYSRVNTLLTGPLNVMNTRDHWKQVLLSEMNDDVIDLVIDMFDRVPSPLSVLALTHEHGAGMRFASDATAFPHRDSPLAVLLLSSWIDPATDAMNTAWARESAKALEPFSTGGTYVNESEDERVTSVYRGNLPRLREIKTRYDPNNFFCANMNIEPLKA